MSKKEFGKLLSEAVDEGLSALGDSSRHAIYFHLEKSFQVKKEEIPERIDIFTKAIQTIFEGGADFIEILIMRRLHEKIGVKFESSNSSDFSLPKYVAAAKRNFVEKAQPRIWR